MKIKLEDIVRASKEARVHRGFFSYLRSAHPYKIGDTYQGARVVETFYKLKNSDDIIIDDIIIGDRFVRLDDGRLINIDKVEENDNKA